MMRQRESRFFIDIKHLFVERKKSIKSEAIINFLSASILDLGDKCKLTDVEKKNLNIYVRDYVGFIMQKKTLLQKDLNQILFDALVCLRAVLPCLPDITTLKKSEMKEYDLIIEKNLSYLDLFFVKKDVRSELKNLLESPYELKFHYFTKYPFKEQLIRMLIETELPEILHFLSFHMFNSMGNKDYIVTAEPRSGGHHRMNLIYYSTESMPIFRKLTFEHEIVGFNLATEFSILSQLADTILYVKDAENKKGQGKPIRIGYHFSPKKTLQLQDNGKVLSSRYPIEFVPIDLRVPVTREINCFYHKITDQMKNYDDPLRTLKLENFEQMIKNKKILLIDPIDSLETLSDRIRFQDLVHEFFTSQSFLEKLKNLYKGKGKEEPQFKVSKLCNVNPHEVKPEDISEVVKKEGMSFPIVVKTTTACGDKNSHFMALALNEEGLKEAEKAEIFRTYDHILQEYVEHDERIYKVYAIGNLVEISQKQSLPNVLDKHLPQTHFFFNSQASMKENPEFVKFSKGFEHLDLDTDLAQLLVEELNAKLNLSLVGYDLIRESKSGAYYLIDINYFPGFKGFPDYRNVLDKHFLHLHMKHNDIKDSNTA